MVSYFTNEPIVETLDIFKNKYNPPRHIMDLTGYYVKNTYLIYMKQQYKQREEALIGTPSAIPANLFIGDLEVRLIESTCLESIVWLKYVDHNFVI